MVVIAVLAVVVIVVLVEGLPMDWIAEVVVVVAVAAVMGIVTMKVNVDRGSEI